MPRVRRQRRKCTHDWQQLQQYTLWPEQKGYELLRPVVLFGETAAERAKETGASERPVSVFLTGHLVSLVGAPWRSRRHVTSGWPGRRSAARATRG